MTVVQKQASALVLVTQTRLEAEKQVNLFARSGIETLFFPTIQIEPVIPGNKEKDLLTNLDPSSTIVFVSKHCVGSFAEMCRTLELSISKRIRMVYIGKETANVARNYDLPVGDFLDDPSEDRLIEFFRDEPLKDRPFLIPKGNLGNPALLQFLRGQGANAESIVCYTNTRPRQSTKTRLRHILPIIDLITLTSPSTVRNLDLIADGLPLKDITVACIGKTTGNAAEKYFSSVLIPKRPGIESMVELASTFLGKI